MKTKLALLSLIIILCTACLNEPPLHIIKGTNQYSSQVVSEWIGLLLKLTQEGPGFSPPVAARAFGYTGLTLYESVRLGMPGYRSMAGQINGLTSDMLPQVGEEQSYYWPAVANASLATIIRNCYNNASAENLTAIDNLESKLYKSFYQETFPRALLDRSVDFGKRMGDAMVSYANSDNQGSSYNSNFPDTYMPPVGEGLWVPTPPAFQKALLPYWGTVRPFLTRNVEEVFPLAPPLYSLEPSSDFWKETMEVYNTVKNLTVEQRNIAAFWSDDPGRSATPPGHSLAILKQVLEEEDASLDLAAEAFAKLGMSVHDAFISCWHAKYHYNLVRPITVIRQNIDPEFTIPLNTPPFPEYPSGHSVQAGASGHILTEMFGDNYAFTDYLHESRSDIDGRARSFSSFNAFAQEAAISRLYGGIHFRSAIEVGLEKGKKIGQNINAINFR